MSPLIAYIRACTLNYSAYLKWKAGDPQIRSYHMYRCRRDWELAAALYRFERRRTYHD